MRGHQGVYARLRRGMPAHDESWLRPDQLRQPLRPEIPAGKPRGAEGEAQDAARPREVEQREAVDQRGDRRDGDGDREKYVRHVELIVAEVQPVVFTLEPLRLGACFLGALLV